MSVHRGRKKTFTISSINIHAQINETYLKSATRQLQNAIIILCNNFISKITFSNFYWSTFISNTTKYHIAHSRYKTIGYYHTHTTIIITQFLTVCPFKSIFRPLKICRHFYKLLNYHFNNNHLPHTYPATKNKMASSPGSRTNK